MPALAVVDHNPIYRRGLCNLLTAQPDLSLVFVGERPAALLERRSSPPPAALLLADDLPLSEPLAVIGSLQRAVPPVPVVVLSTGGDDQAAFQAISAGAAAFLRRDCPETELLGVVRAVAAGHHPIEALLSERPLLAGRVLRAVREGGRPRRRAQPAALTGREIAVLEAAAAGLSNAEIGALLCISPQTVKNHMTSVLAKLAARDRTAAVMTALQRGWLRLPTVA